MRRTPKLFYASGLLSLILLPLLCMQYFLYRHAPSESQYILELVVSEESKSPERLKGISNNCQQFVLNGDTNDAMKLNDARLIVREPKNLKQLAFVFTNRAKYSSLVKLVEICLLEKVPAYRLYQNTFWIFMSTLEQTSPARAGENRMHCSSTVSFAQINTDDAISWLPPSTLEKFILPAILFMVMVGLLIVKARIVAMRAMKQKRAKFLESPSDNPE